MVHDAAGRADHDLGTALQTAELALDTADRRRSAAFRRPCGVPYLCSASATWIASSRVGVRISACTLRCLRIDALDDRQAEGGRLAGAGLGLGDDIATASRAGMVTSWIGVGSS